MRTQKVLNLLKKTLDYMERSYPHYSRTVFKKYGKNVSIIEKVKAFIGACKRLSKGNL